MESFDSKYFTWVYFPGDPWNLKRNCWAGRRYGTHSDGKMWTRFVRIEETGLFGFYGYRTMPESFMNTINGPVRRTLEEAILDAEKQFEAWCNVMKFDIRSNEKIK